MIDADEARRTLAAFAELELRESLSEDLSFEETSEPAQE
jgi:hypothetical protein